MRPDFWLTVEDVKGMHANPIAGPHWKIASVESTEAPEPIYDTDAAVRFIHETTKIAEEDVWTFMRGVNLYELGMGFTHDDEELFETTAAKLRKRYPIFFPPENIEERFLDTNLQRPFIAMETGLAEELVSRMQDAEEEYMRRIGIID